MAERRDCGFSLLEVMVAVAVAGTVLTVILSGFSLSLRATGVAGDVTTATLLARDLMIGTETIGTGATEPVPGRSTGDFGDEFPRHTWEIETSELETEQGHRLWRHVVTVTFERRGRSRSVRLESLQLAAAPADEPVEQPGDG